jgi:hypothetical protein
VSEATTWNNVTWKYRIDCWRIRSGRLLNIFEHGCARGVLFLYIYGPHSHTNSFFHFHFINARSSKIYTYAIWTLKIIFKSAKQPNRPCQACDRFVFILSGLLLSSARQVFGNIVDFCPHLWLRIYHIKAAYPVCKFAAFPLIRPLAGRKQHINGLYKDTSIRNSTHCCT